ARRASRRRPGVSSGRSGWQATPVRNLRRSWVEPVGDTHREESIEVILQPAVDLDLAHLHYVLRDGKIIWLPCKTRVHCHTVSAAGVFPGLLDCRAMVDVLTAPHAEAHRRLGRPLEFFPPHWTLKGKPQLAVLDLRPVEAGQPL